MRELERENSDLKEGSKQMEVKIMEIWDFSFYVGKCSLFFFRNHQNLIKVIYVIVQYLQVRGIFD